MKVAFQRLCRKYLRLRRWERSGRFYERIGVRWLDYRLAAAFGERPVERYTPERTDSRARLIDSLYRGRYSEVVNAMCVVIYFIISVATFFRGYIGLTAYTLGILFTHLMVIPIERYKRALVIDWLQHPEALSDPEPPLPERRTSEQLQHWFYAPKAFETEKFYHKLNVDSYRAFVAGLAYLSSPEEGDPEAPPPNALRKRTPEYLDAFERTTRSNELIHWLGLIQHLPYWYQFTKDAYIPGILAVVWLFYLNVWAALLQRQHRARIFKVLLRRERAERANATAT